MISPYYDNYKPLIQHKWFTGYIVWNWNTANWDKVAEPIVKEA